MEPPSASPRAGRGPWRELLLAEHHPERHRILHPTNHKEKFSN
ncbi:hypothetical protein VULLAG_LOCUS9226 [Vulpes lagopus]